MAYLADYSDVLTQAQRRVWGRIAKIAWYRGGALRGDTACAIHLRHRRSKGLTIVTPEPFYGHVEADQLEHIFTDVQFADITDDSCEAVVEGARVGLFAAPDTPRVAADVVVCGMPVASIPDLMVAKMGAVRFRRELRHHIDLYAMDTLSGYTLKDGIGFWCRRYGHDIARRPTSTTSSNAWPTRGTCATTRRSTTSATRHSHTSASKRPR